MNEFETTATANEAGLQSAIAIVGIGALFPKAANAGHYWANIKNGVDGISEVPPTHWDPDVYFDTDPKKPDFTYARRGGFLSPVDFNPLEWGLPPKDLEATDTSQLLGLVAAKMALDDAGVRFEGEKAVRRDRTSVILGVTGTLELVVPLGARLGHPHWRRAMKDAGIAEDRANDALERMSDSYVGWQENSFPGLLGNVVAGRIANKLDLHGTNCVVDAACASSLSAIHLAILELQTGKADVAVSGGVDTFNDIFMFMCFSKTPALSASGDAKPFDENGDGTILGEGLGIVVLKRLSDAERAGDRIYAVIRGVGTSSDGKGNAIYAPSAEGQKRCLLDAYERAGVDPRTVELVEAHGTGTRVGDATEATALTAVFNSSTDAGHRTPNTALGSVKSQIGHTKAAAGAASLIKVALSLYNKVLPPTLKVTRPVDPLANGHSPFYVNSAMRPWLPRPGHPRRAGMSAFGFGGSNFHAVLEEYSPRKAEPDWDGTTEIFAISGTTREDVRKALDAIPKSWTEFARAAEESRTGFSATASHRLVLAAHRDRTDLAKLLASAKSQLEQQPDAAHWSTPDGAHYGRGDSGKLAVLFPGQGSQSIGMLRDLACLFPEMLDTLAAANGDATPRLTDLIYPPTRYDNATRVQDDAELQATRIAQPALGAVSFGAWLALANRFGVRADAFAGHSYGELTALAAAGRYGPADLFHLSRRRGELMSTARDGDPGSMLAVIAPLDDVERIVRDHQLNLGVANRNAPAQCVLSGPTLDIEKAVDAFRSKSIRTVRLPVAAAFHSPLVSDAAKPFRETLESIEFRPGTVPVFSNTIGKEYPEDTHAAKELLSGQLAQPVEFIAEIRNLLRFGARTFLEVGPGSTLTRLVEAIFSIEPGRAEYAAIALDASGGRKPGTLDLANALAKLASRGHAVNLAGWEAGSRCRPAKPAAKAGLTVPICGANYRAPFTPKPPRLPETPLMPGNAHNPNRDALSATASTLAALQQLQQQTAALHKQFLDSQEQAQRTIAMLVAQQSSHLGVPVPSLPVSAPIPIPSSPPPQSVPPRVVAVPPKPAAPAPAPLAIPKPVAPVAAAGKSVIGTTLLAVVSEKTGYPVEMLDLGMSLDADLGIDSIKRVEILAAIQEKLPDAPAVKPEHLGTLQTLQDVASFLGGGVETGVPDSVESILLPDPHGPTSSVLLASQDLPDFSRILLDVVSEKTGYPVEMLDLGMALDADLGIDSIKRVEILSSLQEKLPEAPVVKPEHLGSLQTLQDVVDFFISASRLGPETQKLPIAPLPAPSENDARALEILHKTEDEPLSALTEPLANVMAYRKVESKYGMPSPRAQTPVEVPRLPPSDENAVERSIVQAVDVDVSQRRPRVPFAEGAEFWVIAEDEPLAAELIQYLTNLRFVARRHNWAALSSAKLPTALAGLVLLAPQRTPPGMPLNRLAFQWVQFAGPKLRAAARNSGACVVSVARLDGTFGLINLSITADPTAGGLAGLVKTVRHEWPEIAVKAIDLNPALVDGAAPAIVEEILAAGPIEVGISPTHRCTLELARTVRRPSGTSIAFNSTDVILVTGGGRGVTAEAAVCLAQSFRSTLILTGRTPMPTGAEPDWAAGITGESALKSAAASALSDATPKSLNDTVNRVLAQREIKATIARIEAAGAKAVYFAVNVSQGRAVADLLHQVKVKYGPITGLVHGAGVLSDRRLENLTADQFDYVFNTKVDGARHLLDFLGGEELKAIILFGSTTGRFGRVGQAAYAAANEVLNKIAQVEARKRPNTRVVCINWGPWEGGMVTPALKKVFEAEGIGLIPLESGAAFLVHELNATGRAVEVIALGSRNRSSGVVSSASASRIPIAAPGTNPPATQPPPELILAFERSVDVASHPVLRSHVLDGRAVLPMTIHMEWLAHAALHGNPGLVFHGFNDLRITHGVMVEDGATNMLRLFAGKAAKQDKLFTVPVELRGRRKDGREVIHSRAEVVLTSLLPKPPGVDRPPSVQPYSHPLDEVYKYFLFHGPDLHGIESIEGLSDTAFIGTAYPAPAPADWFAGPLRNHWVADPLVLDASFQMMILWSFAQHGAGSLPCFAGRYRQYRRAFPPGLVRVVIRINRDNGTFARADIDYLDADGIVIAQVQDYECVIDPGLNQAFRRNQLSQTVKV